MHAMSVIIVVIATAADEWISTVFTLLIMIISCITAIATDIVIKVINEWIIRR